MEDVFVELEGRVEEGANFVLELVDHLLKYFSNTFSRPFKVLLFASFMIIKIQSEVFFLKNIDI